MPTTATDPARRLRADPRLRRIERMHGLAGAALVGGALVTSAPVVNARSVALGVAVVAVSLWAWARLAAPVFAGATEGAGALAAQVFVKGIVTFGVLVAALSALEVHAPALVVGTTALPAVLVLEAFRPQVAGEGESFVSFAMDVAALPSVPFAPLPALASAFTFIGGALDAIGAGWLSGLVTTILVLLLLHQLASRAAEQIANDPQLPTDRFGIRAVFEFIVDFLWSTVKSIVPHHPERYMPLLGTLFIFILVSNLLGLVPGFEPPTSNANLNAAMALVVFLSYHYYGVKEHGVGGYLKQFTAGLGGWLLPIGFLVAAIEVIAHVVRPVTLTIRLAANMIADHMVLGIFTDLTPYLIPVIFLVLGTIVCLIQAFVFFMLSTVYIGLAVSHDH